MNMLETILSRKSVRHYKQEKIDWGIIADILKFANDLPMLIDGIAVEYKLVSNIETKQGFYGPLSLNAPYYICISSEEKENYLVNAGYLMQQISLYINSKGLGTCFIDTATPGKSLKSTMKYKYVTAIAFGKTSKPLFRNMIEAKRLPESDVVVYKEGVSPDIQKMLTAARYAPSHMNSQPWRFVAYKNRIHIFCKKNAFLKSVLKNSKMIDMGIMLANLLLTAEELWIDVSFTKSVALKQKQFPNHEYFITLNIG
ncbi:MAG: hypothetical protein GX288_04240 [Clostridiales bacterium]|nr:hypothetical protein [Clostridiales bacterium]